MSKGGRPKDACWQLFTELIKDGKKVVECKQCKEVIAARADRVKTYIKKCQLPATSVKRERSPSTDEQEELPHKKRTVLRQLSVASSIARTN